MAHQNSSLLLKGDEVIQNGKSLRILISICAAELIRSRIGGRPLSLNSKDGDLVVLGKKAVVEVKAASNNKSYPAIFIHQLMDHIDGNGSNYAHHLYAVVGYWNRSVNPLDKRLKDVLTACDLVSYFARRVMRVYLLDARVLYALHQRFGEREMVHDIKKSAPVVNVRWKVPKAIAREPIFALRQLGLDPSAFWVDVRMVGGSFRGRRLRKFPWLSMVPAELGHDLLEKLGRYPPR